MATLSHILRFVIVVVCMSGCLSVSAATPSNSASGKKYTSAVRKPTTVNNGGKVTLDASRFKQRPVKQMRSDREVMQYVDSVKKKHALKNAGAVTYVGKQPRDPNLTRQFKKDALAKADQLEKKDSRNKWVKDYVKKADVDHPVELQIGGADNKKTNMVLSDPSVNRSMGSQLNKRGSKQEGKFTVDVKLSNDVKQ